ncbi:hypothetical protein PR202_ga08059 [Eleusine coracana subsp. coracana]|uniref:Uncharacterized protein n=1 Tax=Eleusine coracana subsp. coracana TaxID=191504 RepID=A0AAV5C177_ELECO|nr:hypothetical protein PR202_ga08059 [Eleusine coracana subsp. coracana]
MARGHLACVRGLGRRTPDSLRCRPASRGPDGLRWWGGEAQPARAAARGPGWPGQAAAAAELGQRAGRATYRMRAARLGGAALGEAAGVEAADLQIELGGRLQCGIWELGVQDNGGNFGGEKTKWKKEESTTGRAKYLC